MRPGDRQDRRSSARCRQLGPAPRAGMSRDVASKRTKAGRLHRIHRGVYAVGHTRLSFESRCMAAVLALGEGAAVSHLSAAAVWGMLRPHDGPIDVTVSG